MTRPTSIILPTADGDQRPTRLPPNHRALHVIVPEDAHRAAKVAAAQSGMRFRHFMIHLLRQAQPLPPQ